MVTANIIINQIGRPPGLPGQSRDDLVLGVSVTLSNENNSGVNAWNWRLLAKPQGSSAGLSTPISATCAFTPDLAGSYLVQLLLNGVVQATAIAAVKTAYLGLRVPASGETHELGGWEQAIQTLIQQLEDGIPAGGGGGTLDRTLVFSDDTQFAEAGASFVTKKTFRIVRDSNKLPASWRVVVSLWGSASYDEAECRVNAVGIGGTDTVTLSTVLGTAETIVSGNITIDNDNEPSNTLVEIQIQLRLADGGGAANIQYTDVYAVYTSGPE